MRVGIANGILFAIYVIVHCRAHPYCPWRPPPLLIVTIKSSQLVALGTRNMQCKGRRCGRHTARKDELSQHCSKDSIFQCLSGHRRQRWLRVKILNLDSPSRLDCTLRSGSPVELFMLEACDQFRESLCILTFAL